MATFMWVVNMARAGVVARARQVVWHGGAWKKTHKERRACVRFLSLLPCYAGYRGKGVPHRS